MTILAPYLECDRLAELVHEKYPEDVMDTKWEHVQVQCNLIEATDIQTVDDLSRYMKTITDLYEFEDFRITLLAVDDSGKYYTEEGNQGIVRDSHFIVLQKL